LGGSEEENLGNRERRGKKLCGQGGNSVAPSLRTTGAVRKGVAGGVMGPPVGGSLKTSRFSKAERGPSARGKKGVT